MTEKNSKNGIIGGLFWSFGERIAAQLVSALVTIVLARILDPEHYGLISMVTVIITFLNVFVSGGFGSALVQKKDAVKIDFDTAFWISFTLSVVLYAVLFFSARPIALFYENENLVWVIRVIGIRLIFASFNNIQQAYIRKSMLFRKFFWATFIGTALSGIIGIIMAEYGFGVWALVAQYLSNVFIDTVILNFVCGWRPSFAFSGERAKKIWSFGWKVLATDLVFTLEGDIRSLIVGKVFGPADLSFYDQGKKYPAILMNNIDASVKKVMLPAYSVMQDRKEKLRSAFNRSVGVGFYIIAPLLIGFAVVAHNFVGVVLTDKWLPCVPFMQIFCILYVFRPFESSCHQALLAVGKSGLVLITMIIIHSVALTTVLIAVFLLESVLWIAILTLLTTLVSMTVFFVFTKKHIGIKFKDLFNDNVKTFAIVALMGAAAFFSGYIPSDPVFVLIIQILTGGIVYLSASLVFKSEHLSYLLGKLKLIVKRGDKQGDKAKTTDTETVKVDVAADEENK